ncbi:MAG: hypothetical protein ACLT1W_03860 [Alistipes onderdonkii]
MEWLHTLFFGSGIAHAVLTFALVITIGILLGKSKSAASRSESHGFCS